MILTKIPDHKIYMIWKCEDCTDVVYDFGPDWYQDNGTPICECGRDMYYSHTEIELDGTPSKE